MAVPTLSAIVNAAGGLLFVLQGFAILLLARGKGRGLLVGGLAIGFGATYAAQNLIPTLVPTPAGAWLLSGLAVFATLCALGLAADLGRQLPRGPRRAFFAFAAAVALASAVAGVVARVVFGEGFEFARIAPAFLLLPSLVILLAAGGLLLRTLPGEARNARRAIALLSLAFGTFTLYETAAGVGFAAGRDLVATVVLALAGFAVAAAAAFVPSSRNAEPAVGRWTFLALVGFGLAGAVMFRQFEIHDTQFGSYGLVRTIGAALLALAVFRYDLLGVPLPRFAVRRGALATATLATLLIVAQVAQNFLSAEYGLLMGGVVAGALLVAAAPLQRALEARSTVATRTAGPDERSAAIYKAAARAALADGAMTPEEEVHLAEVQEHLGIAARTAVRLRREVEAEQVARSGPKMEET